MEGLIVAIFQLFLSMVYIIWAGIQCIWILIITLFDLGEIAGTDASMQKGDFSDIANGKRRPKEKKIKEWRRVNYP